MVILLASSLKARLCVRTLVVCWLVSTVGHRDRKKYVRRILHSRNHNIIYDKSALRILVPIEKRKGFPYFSLLQGQISVQELQTVLNSFFNKHLKIID